MAMASRIGGYILPMDNLTIRGDLSPTDSMVGIESTSYLDPIDAHPECGYPVERQIYLERHLTSLGKRVSGYNELPFAEDNPHGTGYAPVNLPHNPTHSEAEAFQLQIARYASSNGSFAGDRSTGDSPSYACLSPVPTNASAPSPRPSESQYPDPIGPLSPSLGAGRGPETTRPCSVRSQEMHHFTQFMTQFDDEHAGAGHAFPQGIASVDGSMSPVARHDSISSDHGAVPNYGAYPSHGSAIDPALGPHVSSHSSPASMAPPLKRQRFSSLDGQMSSTPLRSNSSSQSQSPSATLSSAHENITTPSAANTTAAAGNQQQGAVDRRPTPARRKTSGSAAEQQQEPAGKVEYQCSFAAYGCQSTFSSKNEWKRHVSTIHLRLGVYHCELCANNNAATSELHPTAAPSGGTTIPYTASPAKIYNRKDLFAQHLRRMHAPWPSPKYKPTREEESSFEQNLKPIFERCRDQRRNPPQLSHCPFCDHEISGSRCWEDRMEHVGKHFEKHDKQIREDVPLRDWALREGILMMDGRRAVLVESQGSRKRKSVG